MPFLFLMLSLAIVCQSGSIDPTSPPDTQQLGEVKVDDHVGIVLFQDPADDGKSYRVTVAISKSWESPSIDPARIDVWLLAGGGKALPVTVRPRGAALIEAGSLGATANAIYFFKRTVEPRELKAVVVSVDGQPVAFRVKRAK